METDPDGNSILFQLLLLLFFTLMNAFFAGAEMAVVSVNKNRIRSLAEDGNKKALVIQSLFEDSTKLPLPAFIPVRPQQPEFPRF